MRVEAKICGLTRPADAALARSLGASWLGVVMAEGPRRVGLGLAREIAAAGEGLPLLGVFVDSTPDEILRVRDRARLDGAQLHGEHGEYEEGVRARLRAEGMLVWSVARVAGEDDLGGLPALESNADVVLVEPHVAGAHGGTGTSLPLELAAGARVRLLASRMALAGGLRPEVLEAAIALVRPDVVDVSSGVEQAPGVKDPSLLARFMEIARDAGARA